MRCSREARRAAPSVLRSPPGRALHWPKGRLTYQGPPNFIKNPRTSSSTGSHSIEPGAGGSGTSSSRWMCSGPFRPMDSSKRQGGGTASRSRATGRGSHITGRGTAPDLTTAVSARPAPPCFSCGCAIRTVIPSAKDVLLHGRSHRPRREPGAGLTGRAPEPSVCRQVRGGRSSPPIARAHDTSRIQPRPDGEPQVSSATSPRRPRVRAVRALGASRPPPTSHGRFQVGRPGDQLRPPPIGGSSRDRASARPVPPGEAERS